MDLKSDPDSELELTHAHRRTRSGIRFDVRDLTRAAAAIDAGIARNREHGMVEHVVGIEAELRFDALGDREVLRYRHVIVEGMGPTIRKDPGAADLAATRKREG